MTVDRIFCATVLYPSEGRESFDVDRYASEIAPRYARILGDNCIAFEVRRGLNSPGAPAPAFACIASFWVRSRDLFGAALGMPEMKQLMADIAAFSSVQPLRQFDEQAIYNASPLSEATTNN